MTYDAAPFQRSTQRPVQRPVQGPTHRSGQRVSPAAGSAVPVEHWSDDDVMASPSPMLIDCDTCQARGAGCGDCVVTVLLGGPPQGVTLNAEEQRAMEVLAAAGMIPPLRLVASIDPPYDELGLSDAADEADIGPEW